MTQISLSNVSVSYGATTVLRDVTVSIAAGERWGIIGRNGSGKTSLLRIVKGVQQPSAGAVARAPGLRFAELGQHRDFGAAVTVWEAVAEAFRALMDLGRGLETQAAELAQAGADATKIQLDRYARDLEAYEHLGGYTWESSVDEVLEGLGFSSSEARETRVRHLSGGERGRVALAKQLATPADVLLLDEPTNHLDLETTEWLEDFLVTSRETQLIVSHDRAFLDRVVDHVLHLEDNTASAYRGSYGDFAQQRAERRLAQQRAFERQSKTVAREADYIRRNIAGQNSKQAKGRRKRLERLPRLTPPPGDEAAMSIRFDARERGGDQVATFDRAKVVVAERTLLRPFTGWIRRGDVIGLIGPNGTGKTSLLRALSGSAPLDGGEIRVGGAIDTAMYLQDFANVPRDRSMYDVIADLRPMWERGAVMGHLGRVQFSGDETQRSAATLSGGELARLALAMMMLERANFLVFDEPTNHLDVESIEALEDAIERFEGTVLVVSHDRELLRKLVTRVWDLRDGHLTIFDGPFEEWEERQQREAVRRQEAAAVAATERRTREMRREKALKSGAAQSSTKERDAAESVTRAEERVRALEGRVRDLTVQLGDQALYDGSAEGRLKADALAIELERERRALNAAMADWERAMLVLDGES